MSHIKNLSRFLFAACVLTTWSCGGGESGGNPTQTQTNTPSSLAVVQGDNQVGLSRAVLALPIQVVIRDKAGNAVSGATVTFTPSGGGTVSPTTAVTDAIGVASTTWTLGNSGNQTLVASSVGVPSITLNATIGTGSTTLRLVIKAGDNQAAIAGTSVPSKPSVLVVAGDGTPFANATVTFAVQSGGGTITGPVVVTSSNGIATLPNWTLGTVAQVNTVSATASSNGITGGTVLFTAAGCTANSSPTAFDITVCFRTSMTDNQRNAFLSAAAKWSSVIAADVPSDTFALSDSVAKNCPSSSNLALRVDDLLIYANVEPIDGKGGILGSASFCYYRDDGSDLPLLGLMRFDSADLDGLEANGQLVSTILHEMGHVLGIGTLWTDFKLLKDTSTKTLVLDTYFSGPNAIAGFNAIGGSTYLGAKVPVENTGAAGTINSHWRESILKNELMTGFLNSGSNPLSLLTVRSLQDLGYVVNVSAAEPFSIAASTTADLQLKENTIDLSNDIEPSHKFRKNARTGRITRID